jgi:ketosteroid isomerase-like protein
MNEQENTKTVQQVYEMFGTGDIDGLLTHVDDNISWMIPPVENAAWTGARTGKPAVTKFFSELSEAEDFARFEPLEFIAQGDKVVVLGEFEATVKATKKTYQTEWVHVFHLRDGRITEFKEFFDTAKATAAFQRTAAA